MISCYVQMLYLIPNNINFKSDFEVAFNSLSYIIILKHAPGDYIR